MIYLADGTGRYDGAAIDLLKGLQTDIPIVLVSRMEDLVFNTELNGLKGQKYILFNFVELGWNWDMKQSHQFGVNTELFADIFNGEGWNEFDKFVKENPPLLTFSREVLQSELKEGLYPIMYPCFLPAEPLQLREKFNTRAFETIFSWGLSHEYRKDLHGQIWQASGKYGYSVCDNLYHLNQFVQNEPTAKKWLTLNIPWYARMDMKDFIQVNGWAKISISLAGAGKNCFRHAESCVNSVMLMWDDNTAWHQEVWKHGVNCLKCEQGKEIETIIEWLNKPELYDVYLAGVTTVDTLRVENYCNNYILPLINKHCQE